MNKNIIGKKKRSVLFEWTCSYLLVLCIPIIAISLYYGYSVKIVKEEISRANELIIRNIKKEIDLCLDDCIDTYNYFYFDEYLKKWLSYKNIDKEFYNDSYELMNRFAAYTNFEPQISCTVYNEELDYIVMNDKTSYAKRIYSGFEYIYDDITEYEDWIKSYKKEYNNEFFVMSYMHYMTDKTCFVYADSLWRKNNKINIFISVPVSEVISIANSIGEGAVVVVEIKGNPILGLDNKGIIEISEEYKKILSEPDMKDSNYIVITEASDHKQISYSILVPKGSFWKELKFLKYIFYAAFFACLVVSTIIIKALVRKNFKPVSNLLMTTLGKTEKGNEFVQIEQAWHRISSEKVFMQKRIEKQTEELLSSYLLSLMKGRKVKFRGREMDFFRLDKAKEYVLVTFSMQMFDSKKLEYDELSFFAIDNVFSELMEEYSYYKIDDGEFLFCLFAIAPEQRQDWGEKCEKAMTTLFDFLDSKWEQVPVMSYVSNKVGDIEQIRFLYKETMGQLQSGQHGTKKKKKLENVSNPTENQNVYAVMKYIDENYTDENLNVDAIAEAVNKNPKYLNFILYESIKPLLLSCSGF